VAFIGGGLMPTGGPGHEGSKRGALGERHGNGGLGTDGTDQSPWERACAV
jgi:hypothetical protein